MFKQKHDINLTYIESRVSQSKKNCYEFIITCQNTNGNISEVLGQLRNDMKSDVLLLTTDKKIEEGSKFHTAVIICVGKTHSFYLCSK